MEPELANLQLAQRQEPTANQEPTLRPQDVLDAMVYSSERITANTEAILEMSPDNQEVSKEASRLEKLLAVEDLAVVLDSLDVHDRLELLLLAEIAQELYGISSNVGRAIVLLAITLNDEVQKLRYTNVLLQDPTFLCWNRTLAALQVALTFPSYPLSIPNGSILETNPSGVLLSLQGLIAAICVSTIRPLLLTDVNLNRIFHNALNNLELNGLIAYPAKQKIIELINKTILLEAKILDLQESRRPTLDLLAANFQRRIDITQNASLTREDLVLTTNQMQELWDFAGNYPTEIFTVLGTDTIVSLLLLPSYSATAGLPEDNVRFVLMTVNSVPLLVRDSFVNTIVADTIDSLALCILYPQRVLEMLQLGSNVLRQGFYHAQQHLRLSFLSSFLYAHGVASRRLLGVTRSIVGDLPVSASITGSTFRVKSVATLHRKTQHQGRSILNIGTLHDLIEVRQEQDRVFKGHLHERIRPETENSLLTILKEAALPTDIQHTLSNHVREINRTTGRGIEDATLDQLGITLWVRTPQFLTSAIEAGIPLEKIHASLRQNYDRVVLALCASDNLTVLRVSYEHVNNPYISMVVLNIALNTGEVVELRVAPDHFQTFFEAQHGGYRQNHSIFDNMDLAMYCQVHGVSEASQIRAVSKRVEQKIITVTTDIREQDGIEPVTLTASTRGVIPEDHMIVHGGTLFDLIVKTAGINDMALLRALFRIKYVAIEEVLPNGATRYRYVRSRLDFSEPIEKGSRIIIISSLRGLQYNSARLGIVVNSAIKDSIERVDRKQENAHDSLTSGEQSHLDDLAEFLFLLAQSEPETQRAVIHGVTGFKRQLIIEAFNRAEEIEKQHLGKHNISTAIVPCVRHFRKVQGF